MRSKMKGFTLMELIIAIVIVGILLAVAIPAYSDQVRKTRRAQAKADLQELTQILERRYTINNSYNNPAFTLPFTVSPREGQSWYDLTIVVADNTFTITATPTGDQATDKCGTLTINNAGATTPALSTHGCWN